MAVIGQQLLEAESGWTRYDITLDNQNINFPINTEYISNSNYYGSNAIRITKGQRIEFYFKGTGIRLISVSSTNQSEKIEVKIDDNLVDFFSCNSASTVFKLLSYEKIGLDNSVHKVSITNLSSTTNFFTLDTIDLIGELLTIERRLIIKNPTTNQHYSLAEKTLIILPDGTSKNMILHGIEAGKEIKLDEAFDKIQYSTNDIQATVTTTKKPFIIKFKPKE